MGLGRGAPVISLQALRREAQNALGGPGIQLALDENEALAVPLNGNLISFRENLHVLFRDVQVSGRFFQV